MERTEDNLNKEVDSILKDMEISELKFLFQKWLVYKSTGKQESDFILDELDYSFKDNDKIKIIMGFYYIKDFSVVFIKSLEDKLKEV